MPDFLRSSTIFPKTLTPYIRHPRLPNLYVLPYVKGRLVFAELLARAVEEESFDLLVADLPHFLNDKGILDLPVGIFPLVSSLVMKGGPSNFALLPFVPSDAGCLAAYFGKKKFAGFFECIDDNLMNYGEGHLYHPDLKMKDDYFVFDMGLEEYFSPYGEKLRLLLDRAAFVRRFCTMYRAFVVAKRLRECLARGGRTLFVCEYQLWEHVKGLLEDVQDRYRLSTYSLKAQDWNAAWIIEDPLLLWSHGLLDDYPTLNLRFFSKLLEGEAHSFDKLGTLDGLLQDFVLRTRHPDIERLLSFMRYLRARLVLSSRIIPAPSEQLFDSARSCLKSEEAAELAKSLLDYPYPQFENGTDADPTYFKIGPTGITLAGRPFDLPDLASSSLYWGASSDETGEPSSVHREEREYWAQRARPYLTRQEVRSLRKGGEKTRWAVKSDYLLHDRVCNHVLDTIRKGRARFFTARSFGSVGHGIDWKATIAARAKNDMAVFIKKRKTEGGPTCHLDEFTPMVFIFSSECGGCEYFTVHDSNLSKRLMDLNGESLPSGKHPQPDFVYSIFMVVRETEFLTGAHINREHMNAISFLFTRCSLMGVERYEALNRQPKKYQCRTAPASDDELKKFSPDEMGVAWAAKYAREVVIVVAHQGWKPSAELLKFAAERDIKILTIPMSILSPGTIQRFRKMHFVSTALKKAPESEKIVERFIGTG